LSKNGAKSNLHTHLLLNAEKFSILMSQKRARLWGYVNEGGKSSNRVSQKRMLPTCYKV